MQALSFRQSIFSSFSFLLLSSLLFSSLLFFLLFFLIFSFLLFSTLLFSYLFSYFLISYRLLFVFSVLFTFLACRPNWNVLRLYSIIRHLIIWHLIFWYFCDVGIRKFSFWQELSSFPFWFFHVNNFVIYFFV